jgi:peroxiredoxin Q/BCP
MKELKAYQGDIARFRDAETEILGISINRPSWNRAFSKSLGLTFPLLSDTEKKVAREYGVLNRFFPVADRTTFAIDKQGIIRRIERGREALRPEGALSAVMSLEERKT